MLSGKAVSLLLETSRVFNFSNNPMESGKASNILDERFSSSRFSRPAIESGIDCPNKQINQNSKCTVHIGICTHQLTRLPWPTDIIYSQLLYWEGVSLHLLFLLCFIVTYPLNFTYLATTSCSHFNTKLTQPFCVAITEWRIHKTSMVTNLYRSTKLCTNYNQWQ